MGAERILCLNCLVYWVSKIYPPPIDIVSVKSPIDERVEDEQIFNLINFISLNHRIKSIKYSVSKTLPGIG